MPVASQLSLARHTITVLETLRRLTDEDRRPTSHETAVLRQWYGWGSVAPAFAPRAAGSWAQIGAELRLSLGADELKSAESATPTSYFTDPRLTSALWDIATGVGFGGGRALEVGCGSGAFMAAAPDLRLRWTGVERDPTSARIAQARFPGAQIINLPLEQTPLPQGGFDLVIGNVPFADVGIYDKTARWRIVSSIDDIVTHAGEKAATLLERSETLRARATEREVLSRQSFPHSGALQAAVTRKSEIDELMAEQAARDAAADRRQVGAMPDELMFPAVDGVLDLPRVVVPPSVAALIGQGQEPDPEPRTPLDLPAESAELVPVQEVQGELDVDVAALMDGGDGDIGLPLTAAWMAFAPVPTVQDALDLGEMPTATKVKAVQRGVRRPRRPRLAHPAQEALFEVAAPVAAVEARCL